MKRPVTFYAFWLTHLLALQVFFLPFKTEYLVLCLLSFLIRSFGVGVGFHRYFSHKSFQTSRAFQFVLAVLGTMTMQSNMFWWVSGHRKHHKLSDKEGDLHSPKVKGFWWAHQNWFWDESNEVTDLSTIQDLVKFPELRFIDKHYLIPGLALTLTLLAFGGVPWLIWGFVVPTLWLWHSTFIVNSLGHLWGTRPYDTKDESHNAWILVFFLADETWHNNHHRVPSSARSGHLWWEFDYNYLILKSLSFFGIVWDLKTPSQSVLDERKK
jgi:stearoyl-CoA desaturase (delta-9 desaturase)